MDLAYTPAQQELKARAAAYAELLMGYEDESEQAGGPLPKETVDKLTRAAMDAGMFGINMPVKWGGAGLTLLEQVIVEEEFGKVTNCLWDIPWRPANVLALASAEQRERYLLPILRGERFDAFATTEPDAGSDAGAIATTATPVDGGFVINGEKWFVTCGDVADFLLVQANVLPGNASTLFFVEKDTPGVRISRTPHFMHSAVNGHPEFVFEDVFVPTESALGDIAVNRAYTHQVAWEADHGVDRKTLHAKASIAKLSASEAAGRVVDRCLQIFGGRGYDRSYPIERMYREVRVDRIWEGTSEIQRVIVANELIKRGTAFLDLPVE